MDNIGTIFYAQSGLVSARLTDNDASPDLMDDKTQRKGRVHNQHIINNPFIIRRKKLRYQKNIQSQTARATDTTASRTLRITVFSDAGMNEDDSAVSKTRPTVSPKLSRACDFTGSVQSLPCSCVTTGLVARSGRQRIMAATISSMPHPVRADTTQTG